MALPIPRAFVARSLLALGALALAAVGCAYTEDPTPVDEPAALPAGHVDLGEYVAHVSPKHRTLTLTRVRRKPTGPGLGTQSIDEITIDQDGTPGVGAANAVELVTNSTGTDSSCPAGFQTKSFCGNVTMRSFYAGQALNNVYLQVTKLTDSSGVDTTTHSGLNSDASFSTLSNTLGLWKFTGSGVTSPGVLAQAVVTSLGGDAGSRDLVFANPDDDDTNIYLHAYATLTYSTYTMTPSRTSSFIDACTAAAGIKQLLSTDTTKLAQVTLPFPFTFYGITYYPTSPNGKITITRDGTVGFGSLSTSTSSPYNTGANVALPSTSTTAFQPGIFPFWDDLNYTTNLTTSGVCTAVSGLAPNRQLVITWKNMKFFGNTNGTDNLTFSALLSEGSDRIDFAYSVMTSTASTAFQARANGNSATIGVQNENGNAAKALNNVTSSAGTTATKGYALIPQP